MAENRTEYRQPGYAKVLLNNTPGYLRNLTETGFKIITLTPLEYKEGEIVPVQILPDETSGLGRITLKAELRWKKDEKSSFEYGFKISDFNAPGNKSIYFKLVELYGRC